MSAFRLYGKTFNSRLLLGTARYPDPSQLQQAISESGTELVTVSIRRQAPGKKGGERFWDTIRKASVAILPNTAGCRSVKEAVSTAHLARELFETEWVKLEVIGNEYTLQPDPFGLLEAARVLVEEGFKVLPYTTDDIVLGERLLSVGCQVLMPWGSPIGSGLGLQNEFALKTMRSTFSEVPLIVDAGIGAPSHAARAMELGFDGVLLNTAVSRAERPSVMACAFAQAIDSGRKAFEAGLMEPRTSAVPSTPVLGTPFWRNGAQAL